MPALPLRVSPASRETLPSFLSRMAAVNGLNARNFAVDMGFSLRKLVDLDEAAVYCLAERSGLDDDELAELLSWTGRPVGEARMQFRGEVFVSRALRNPTVRGCPVCLREVAETGAPAARMAMRGDWQLREVSLCICHGHPLVALWETHNRTERHDVGARLAEMRNQILSGDLDLPREAPSPYDFWLDERLDNGHDETWLATHSLYAATTFCRLLGMELFRSDNLSKSGDVRAAQAAGFAVASNGKEAIRAALRHLAGQATGAQNEPKKVFGQLYIKFSSQYLHEADFAPFRELLRDQVLETWAFGAGDLVLGERLPARRLHSVTSAAKEAGLSEKKLEPILVEAGAIVAKDTRPANRKTFDAVRFGQLIAEIPHWIGVTELRSTIGATQNEVQALIEDGILVPATAVPTVVSPWRSGDGLALIAGLQALVVENVTDDDAWETLQMGAKRAGLRIGAIIAAIQSGALRLGCRAQAERYHGFVVRKEAIDALAREVHVRPEGLIPAAEFGRAIGCRGKDGFLAFLAAGHSPSKTMRHSKNGVTRLYMDEADREAFHQRFATLSTLSENLELHRNTVLARLDKAAVRPFAPFGQTFGPIYLREEAERVFRRKT